MFRKAAAYIGECLTTEEHVVGSRQQMSAAVDSSLTKTYSSKYWISVGSRGDFAVGHRQLGVRHGSLVPGKRNTAALSPASSRVYSRHIQLIMDAVYLFAVQPKSAREFVQILGLDFFVEVDTHY
jgi:hypothetical protein